MTVTREEFDGLVARVDKLQGKVAETSAKLKDAEPQILEHDDRLDGHDATLGTMALTVKHLSTDLADVKRSLLILSGGLDRIFNAVTPLLMSSDNMNKVLLKVAHQVETLHGRMEDRHG